MMYCVHTVFIETSENQQILIDGGPDDSVLEKLGKEMPFWDRTIDLIVLTHPDFDHISGLIEVLRRYKVENILWTGISCETAQCQEWERLIEEEGANIFTAKSGLRIFGGRTSGGRYDLLTLFPLESLEGKAVSNTNDSSIVLRLDYGENSLLLAGDISKSIERKLENIGADVLKVAHHGSKTSTAPEFVEAVSPQIAVISAGRDNKYGHPHEETLATLGRYGINILRTDINGDIKFLWNSHYSKLK